MNYEVGVDCINACLSLGYIGAYALLISGASFSVN